MKIWISFCKNQWHNNQWNQRSCHNSRNTNKRILTVFFWWSSHITKSYDNKNTNTVCTCSIAYCKPQLFDYTATMKKTISSIVLLFYCFSSSLYIHAAGMGFVWSAKSETNNEHCHTMDHTEHQWEPTGSNDCIEHCLGENDKGILFSTHHISKKYSATQPIIFSYPWQYNEHQQQTYITYHTHAPPSHLFSPYNNYIGITILII